MNVLASVIALLGLAAVCVAAVPTAVAGSAWAHRNPGRAAHTLVTSTACGTICLFLATLTLAAPLEPISGTLSWALSACDRSLHLAYLTPGGQPVVAAAAGIAALMLWRLARATRKRAAQISATRLAVEEIVALSATPLPGNVPAVVVTDVRPAAWCIPGRLGRSSNDGIIVVTSGAAELLAPAELHAVLAHERQHLTGHHQRYTTVMTLCTAMLQWLPGLTTRSATVAELLEMSADDHAAATYGHEAVATALLTLAPLAGHKPPLALAISGTPAARRIDRLLDATDPSEQPRTWRSLAAFLLATFTPLLVAVAPAIVVTVSGLCHV